MGANKFTELMIFGDLVQISPNTAQSAWKWAQHTVFQPSLSCQI